MSGRARRREDRERAVRRMRRIFHEVWGETRAAQINTPPHPNHEGNLVLEDHLSPEALGQVYDDMVRRWADNRKKCGCYMCSSRKSEREETPQELRARAAERDW